MQSIKNLPLRCVTAGHHEKLLESYIWTAKWLRNAEVEAAKAHNITLYQLMQRAGKAAFDVICREYPSAKHLLIFCGTGNNGGDGYEIARLAADANKIVTVVAIKSLKPLPPEATAARDSVLQRSEIKIYDSNEWNKSPKNVDIIVDALLGTGAIGAPKSEYATLINFANNFFVPRISIDIPSGLNAETGDVVDNICIQADHTISFIALKPGLFTGKARNYVGKLHYNCLGLGEWMLAKERLKEVFCRRIVGSDLPALLPHTRPPCSHKGSNGKVLLIGGDHGLGGAIIMAAEAALHTGAGLVRVLTQPEYITPLLSRCPEIMVESLTDETLKAALDWCTCVVVGPGLHEHGEWGSLIVDEVDKYLERYKYKPSVWDAGALKILTRKSIVPKEQKKEKSESIEVEEGKETLNTTTDFTTRIFTPHPGEAATLLGCSIKEIEEDRFAAAQAIADRYNAVILLKGPGTILRAPSSSFNSSTIISNNSSINSSSNCSSHHPLLEPPCVVADVGNCGMASGGMGDVLGGVAGALLAQQLPTFQAACVGATAHGSCADLAVLQQGGGPRGLRATALFQHIPACVNPEK